MVADTHESMNDEFSHAEAVAASKLPARSILQWRQRELFPALGRMHPNGRYVYSRRDIIELRVARELVHTAGSSPSMAVEVAGGIIGDLSDAAISTGQAEPLICWVFRPDDVANSSQRHEFTVYKAEDFWRAAQSLRLEGVTSALFLDLTAIIRDVDRVLELAGNGDDR